MIPQHREGQSFADHQQEMAEWMGCTVEELNERHDDLHRELTRMFDVPSYSLVVAAGVELSEEGQRLAGLEECAVLHVQRWLTALSKHQG